MTTGTPSKYYSFRSMELLNNLTWNISVSGLPLPRGQRYSKSRILFVNYVLSQSHLTGIQGSKV